MSKTNICCYFSQISTIFVLHLVLTTTDQLNVLKYKNFALDNNLDLTLQRAKTRCRKIHNALYLKSR